MASIYLLRHGKASFGAADYDRLDPLGVRQAECLGRALAACRLRDPVFFTGSLRRHHETLAACMEGLQASGEVLVDPRWNEFDHERILQAAYPREVEQLRGAIALDADSRRAFQRLLEGAMARWVAGAHDADYTETWSGFAARVSDALASVATALGAGRDAVVSTSGGPIAMAVRQALSLADAQAVALNWVIANASYTRLIAACPPRLASFNVHAHLEQAGPEWLTYR